MLDLLLAGREAEVKARVAELARLPRGDKGLVERVEREVEASPGTAIRFDPNGRAMVHADGRLFAAGKLELLEVAQLEGRHRPGGGKRARFSVLLGADPLTDIGFLQATAPPGTTFQVASQFNCLESPDPGIVPVHRYLKDPTQGPRAAVSAFPAALVRHYAAPMADGTPFVQIEDGAELDLLWHALPVSVGRVRGGYLIHQNLTDARGAADALEKNLRAIRVGVHRDVHVVFGGDWNGPVPPYQRITQVLTSTFAGGGYSGEARIEGDIERICRSLLRAAYLGTLLAAEGPRVVLTLIGGGVFGNPHALIFDSILWALTERDRLSSAPLEVVLNARQLDDTLTEDEVAEAVRARGGALVRVDQGRLRVA